MDNNLYQKRLEELAKEKISKMTEEEKNQRINRYKRPYLIVCLIIIGCCLSLAFMFAFYSMIPDTENTNDNTYIKTYSLDLSYGETVFSNSYDTQEEVEPPTLADVLFNFVFCFSLSIPAGVFLLIKMVNINKKKDAVLLNLIKKDIHKTQGENIARQVEQETFPYKDFKISKLIKLHTKIRVEQIVFFDDDNKKFVIKKGYNYSKKYNYLDIISYNVYENSDRQILHRGNLINICSDLKIIINIKDFNTPQISLDYLIDGEVPKTDFRYENMNKSVREVCAYLEYALSAKQLKETTVIEKSVENIYNIKAEPKPLSAEEQIEELASLKQMLYSGLITQEEYELKKKQILKL